MQNTSACLEGYFGCAFLSHWSGRPFSPQAVDVRAPPNQLRLSEEKLDQDANIFLKAKNPNAPHTIARFSFKEHVYKNEPTVDQTFFLVSIDG